ncbi:MAG: hypothetical protein SCJ94_10690, partial [Bacillota bacterium]|nr:hypothetical protein [Bacillota bacterium]
ENRHLQQYLTKFLPAVISNIYNAVNSDALNKVFITCKYTETATRSSFSFSFGRKMDDEKYRKVIDEILQCRYSTDKMLIIKENINSLSDLEDLLHDAQLTEKEILKVLGSLEISEIAALAKRNRYSSSFEEHDLTESEIMLRKCLDSFIRKQPPVYREQVIQLAKSLQDI